MSDHDIHFLRTAEDKIAQANPEHIVQKAIELARDGAVGVANALHKIRTGGASDLASVKDRWFRDAFKSFPIFFGRHNSNGQRTLDKVGDTGSDGWWGVPGTIDAVRVHSKTGNPCFFPRPFPRGNIPLRANRR